VPWNLQLLWKRFRTSGERVRIVQWHGRTSKVAGCVIPTMRRRPAVMAQCGLIADPGPARGAGAPDRLCAILEAVQALAPLIAGQRNDFDGDRRLPDAVFAALADAGLFRLWLSQALGGPELSAFEFMRVVEAASALDGSVGWLVGNGGG